jgi:PAS domain S-box-containing protein
MKQRRTLSLGRTASVRRVDKRAQARSDLLLSLAVEAGSIGIFETDLERRRTRFSPELCDILGLPIGTEMPYEEAFGLIDERDREVIRVKAEAARNSADRGKWSGVCRVRRSDGEIRWISLQGRRIYQETAADLRAVRSIATVIDITHFKETEAALIESELRLRLALDAARMGTFEADITGSEALIDEREALLLGLPADARVVSADEMRTRIPPEDLQVSDIKRDRMTALREAYHHEFRLRMPDGSERWLSAYADVRGNRIFGVNFDVTERKAAESALRDSEARLRIATAGAALGVFEWHPEGDRSIWGNDRVYEIFGRSRDQGPLSKRQFVEEYLHPADARHFEAGLREAIETGGSFHTICRMRRKGSTQRWLQIDGRLEPAATDKPARLVGVIADITDRKRLATRAERLAERLLTIQEEERRNIAQELHDSTVQHLVAASLLLTSLRPGSADNHQKSWDELEAMLGEAMKELRTFSYLMHPPALDAQGLHVSLRQYVEGFAERSGLDCRLRTSRKSERLPVRLQRSVFRIVQEGLANAYRHASASQVSVAVRRIGARLHVIISDNGRGMDMGLDRVQSPHGRPGVGIRGIRMRLSQMNGRLRISRPPAGGTRLHAVLPVAFVLSGRIAREQKRETLRNDGPRLRRAGLKVREDAKPQS